MPKVAKQISIDYDLWEQARELAKAGDMTMSALVAQLLQKRLREVRAEEKKK
jgi:macrodomain Ter protein organizer (MatP/YcbG family)